MTISLKHAKTSAVADGPDTSLVRPSDWNAEHVLTQATARILGRSTAGTGATEELTAQQVADFVAQLIKPTEQIIIPIGDESTVITTGTAKTTFRLGYAFTVIEVRASLKTASSSGTPTFDINEAGTTILSTKLTIDANELTSTTAATPPVISDASIADDAELTIDIDVAGTGAVGAKIVIIGHRT